MEQKKNLLNAGLELNLEDGRLVAKAEVSVTTEGMMHLGTLVAELCKKLPSIAAGNNDSNCIEYKESKED